jgi:hypothetical protein
MQMKIIIERRARQKTWPLCVSLQTLAVDGASPRGWRLDSPTSGAMLPSDAARRVAYAQITKNRLSVVAFEILRLARGWRGISRLSRRSLREPAADDLRYF